MRATRAKFSRSTDDPSAHQIELPAADDDGGCVAKDDLRRISRSAVLQEREGDCVIVSQLFMVVCSCSRPRSNLLL